MVGSMDNKFSHLKNYLHVLFFALVCCAVFFLTDPSISVMQLSDSIINGSKDKTTIVIDAGHGGRDPGKVAVNGALEKDINLSIALKLKKLLEDNDYNVLMIREEDKGLYSDSDSNKKAADMRKRVEIINNSDALIAISIHQNSFTQESIKGAQVFYYSGSEQGKKYAEIMQEQIIQNIKDDNKRKAKSNDSYYMLKKTQCPIVIVECGYLSNQTEAALLIDDKYQDKMAQAIHLGLMSYIKEYTTKTGK
jgi:N-acetylmuramoyl-L-alanine amidase